MTADWMLGTDLTDVDMSGDKSGNSDWHTSRFWMKQDTEKKILFLSEANQIISIFEHQVKLGGDWRHWFTCLNHDGKTPCPLCEYSLANANKFRRTKVAYLSILDLTPWKAKDGTEHKFTPRLFGAKNDTVELLKRRYLERVEAGQSLKYSMYTVFRSKSDKSPNVGSDFSFIKMVDPSVLPEEVRSGMDLMEELKPDREKMEGAVKQLMAEAGYAGGGGGAAAGGDIPF